MAYQDRFRRRIWWIVFVFAMVDLITPFVPLTTIALLAALFAPPCEDAMRQWLRKALA